MTPDELILKIVTEIKVSKKEAATIIEKAVAGGETDVKNLEEWYTKRFKPNLVFIKKDDYARMCIDALKILGKTAATDYGGSRQRDLAQLWADMTRGYLGEQAIVQFLKEKFNIDSEFDHSKGDLKDYIQMDIKKVLISNKWREPKLKIGIKTTKWNGIWFDIPGAQFHHSDINVLVKIGASREHLFTLFKEISVFKDKILKIGVEVGSLTEKEAKDLYDELPSFQPITAYITGFVTKDVPFRDLDYGGKTGRLNFTITSWKGPIKPGDLDKIKLQNKISGKVTFLGIGSFSHDAGYLFNTGTLHWKKEDWEKLIKML